MLSEMGHGVSVYDKLTGLYEKKYFLDHLAFEVERCARYHRPLSALMMEFHYDYFESEMDVRWSMGYSLFKQLGSILLATLRNVDMASRYDGSNVAVFLPETGLEGAQIAAERIRARVEKHEFLGTNPGERVRVAMNLGIAIFPGHGDTGERLLDSGRLAMRMAREKGGNRAVVAPDPGSRPAPPPAGQSDAPESWDRLAEQQQVEGR